MKSDKKEWLKSKLSSFIKDDWTFIGILVLILISVAATVTVSIVPDGQTSRTCEIVSDVLTFVFVIELVIRWYVSDSHWNFVKDCWIEILAVFPVSRSFRMLRLMRLVSWGFRARRQHRFQSFGSVLSENIVFIVVPIAILIGSTTAIISCEASQGSFSSPLNSLFWSFSTLMAGEPIFGQPVTMEGKVITTILMLAGFTFFAFFTGVVSSYMTKRLRGDIAVDQGLLSKLQDHIIICGWNGSAPEIIRELRAAADTKKKDIIVVSEEKPHFDFKREMKNGELLFVTDDYTAGETLERIRVDRAFGIVFLAGQCKTKSVQDHDARTVLAALTAEKICDDGKESGIYSCAELLEKNESKWDVLNEAHVEETLEASEFLGHLVAHSVLVEGLSHILDNLLTSKYGTEFQLIKGESRKEIESNNKDSEFGDLVAGYKGKDGVEGWSDLFFLNLGRKSSMKKYSGSIVVGYYSNDEQKIIINPTPQEPVPKDADLLIIAPMPVGQGKKSKRDKLTVSKKKPPSQGHTVICGWNRSVPDIIKELNTSKEGAHKGITVILDMLVTPAEFEVDSGVKVVRGDFTSPQVLKKAEIENAQTVIIVADSQNLNRTIQDRDARTVLAALIVEKMVKKQNRSIRICVELLNVEKGKDSKDRKGEDRKGKDRENHKVELLRDKVEMVVSSDTYLGHLIAQSIKAHGLATVLYELLTSSQGCKFGKFTFTGKTMYFHEALVKFLDEEQKLVIGLHRSDSGKSHYIANPSSDSKVKDGDELFYIFNPHKKN